MLTHSGSCGIGETTRKSTPEALYHHDSHHPAKSEGGRRPATPNTDKKQGGVMNSMTSPSWHRRQWRVVEGRGGSWRVVDVQRLRR